MWKLYDEKTKRSRNIVVAPKEEEVQNCQLQILEGKFAVLCCHACSFFAG
jgi:hypothetical protein